MREESVRNTRRGYTGVFESLDFGWLVIREDHRLYLHFIIYGNKSKRNTQALIWLSR